MNAFLKSPVSRTVILAVGLAICGTAIGNGIIQNRKLGNAIEVRGLAERLVKSNEAVWSVSYRVSGDTLEHVNSAGRRAQELIEKYFKEYAIGMETIQKQAMEVSDRRGYGSKKEDAERLPNYEGTGKYVISSKDVDGITRVKEGTDTLLKQGVLLERSALSYYFTDLNRIKPEMLREATANAQEAAQSFARDSGASVGGIKSASQGYFTIGSPFSEYDYVSSIQKRVRVVTSVSYSIR
jgi:hypothetical protein